MTLICITGDSFNIAIACIYFQLGVFYFRLNRLGEFWMLGHYSIKNASWGSNRGMLELFVVATFVFYGYLEM